MDDLKELEEASIALARLDERRTNQARYRDDVIRKSLANGATWVQVMDASGLSRRGVQQAIARN